MTANRPIHVCSLSMSALREVDDLVNDCSKTIDQMDREEKLKDEGQFKLLNRYRWAQLAMQYNQHMQLQYIYKQQGDKGNYPEFRQIKMKPLFKYWRKQIMRDNWVQLQKAIYKQTSEKKIQDKADHFVKQRALLAGKSFKETINLYTVPTIGLVDLSALNYLMNFKGPKSCSLNYENMVADFADSDVVQDFSSTFDQISSDDDETFEGRYRQEFIQRAKGPTAPVKIQSRGIVGDELDTVESDDDGIYILPSTPKVVNQEPANEKVEEEEEEKEEIVEEEVKKEDVKEETKKNEETPVVSAPAKKRSYMVYIIALVALLAAVIVYFMFFKGGSAPVQPKKK